MVADAVGDRVAVGAQWLVEVDDGLEDDLGVGVGAPGPDLVEQEEALAFFHAAEVVEGDPAVADCGGVEVDVEDELPGRGELRAGVS